MSTGTIAIPFVNSRPPDWASGYGQDRYGYFAEFSVVTGPRYWEFITQRMRWIPPGTFLMGSPQGERDRDSDETPHEVTLRHGYWLADTACTQELWEAVMGWNPSKFKDVKGMLRPVEQVSFDDVSEFLVKLHQRVPHGTLTLPTEAQWEYGCRAGTKSPFSFGETISPDQVNFDGNYPYGDSPKGEYREETVEVKSLPANRWGSMRCTAMCGSGVQIGTRSIRQSHRLIPLGQRRARSASCAAAVGTTALATCGLPLGAGTTRAFGATAWASAS